MYKSYWGMEFNPFQKEISEKQSMETKDFKQAKGRLEYLEKTRGIGLFTGLAGTGKTYTMRCFTSGLNSNLYKVVYIPLSTVTVPEFYRMLAYGLGLEPPCKKIDVFNQIRDTIVTLAKNKKITPVIIIDEAQYLKTDVINDIKLLLNFEMDSKNHAIFILLGQPVLNNILSKQVHEALKQRILISYNFDGISKEETEEYITSRFKSCGVCQPLFDKNSLEAIASCSNGSIRKVNNLVEKCLILGAKNKVETINTEIVMIAQNEIELT